MRSALLCLLLIASMPLASAATPTPTTPATVVDGEASGYHADTGDAWIDRQLADLNVYAQRYPDSFLDDLARYANVRRGYVEALLRHQHWPAGDIYFACVWAFSMNLPCGEVVRGWSRDHHDGWKGVLSRLPIAPNNLHYRAVRHAIVASYDRWWRPITLDRQLQRQLGDQSQRRQRALAAAQAALAANEARL